MKAMAAVPSPISFAPFSPASRASHSRSRFSCWASISFVFESSHRFSRALVDGSRRSPGLFCARSGCEVSRFADWSASYGGGRVVGRRSWGAFAVTGTEELPVKLQEIVLLFQQVADPRAKYEQLLYYAKRLKPLGKEFCTKENKVEGCVSQVWVRTALNVEDSTVVFEADSDSLITKGLAALLVEGLSGATVGEVLKLTPDFIQMLGLKQSLTPSRSNGFLNMLKLMQKKTLHMYMDAEASISLSAGSAREYRSAVGASVVQASRIDTLAESGTINNASGPSAQQSKKSSIEKKLQEALSPTVLVVDDVSHQHAGHAGVHTGAIETHFNVKVVSDKFTGSSLIKRHRLIYDLLDEELKNGVHALSLVTKSPSEASS